MAIFLGLASTASAQTLSFPSNASLQKEVVSVDDSYDLPIGIWAQDMLPTRTVEGRVTQQAWRIEAASLTTLQLLRPLREQLQNARFQTIFECQTEACGGFDFRFGVSTMTPPEMQINIGDFRFLAAEKTGEDGPEFITLFVSRTAQAGFVQVTHIGPRADEQAPLSDTQSAPMGSPAIEQSGDDIAAQLDASGRAVLRDLTFETGSARLATAVYPALQAVADYLRINPTRTIALVGHTDASGALDANIALSERRAASVLERLVSDYGVARQRLEAEGVGYLLPLASNDNEAGREANRRVEAVVTSTTD